MKIWKIALSVVVLVIIITVITLFLQQRGLKIKEGITQESLNLANTITRLYQGIDRVEELNKEERKYITDDVMVKLFNFNKDLKSHEDAKFNVTEYFNNKFPDYDNRDTLSEYKSGPSQGEVFPEENNSEEYIPSDDKDSRIFEEGGNDFISVNSMDFTDPKGDIVQYKGIYFNVKKEEVPETYEMMIENPDNYYNYSTHKVVESKNGTTYVDVLYSSVTNGKTLVVRVFNKKGKITDFGVVR